MPSGPCPECGNTVALSASSCPKCGNTQFSIIVVTESDQYKICTYCKGDGCTYAIAGTAREYDSPNFYDGVCRYCEGKGYERYWDYSDARDAAKTQKIKAEAKKHTPAALEGRIQAAKAAMRQRQQARLADWRANGRCEICGGDLGFWSKLVGQPRCRVHA